MFLLVLDKLLHILHLLHNLEQKKEQWNVGFVDAFWQPFDLTEHYNVGKLTPLNDHLCSTYHLNPCPIYCRGIMLLRWTNI